MDYMDYIDDFKLNKEGLSKVLGDLESEIMEILWEKNYHTVREVYEELRLKKKIAYTTVMTIMGRLAEKGLLKIDKEGTAYRYTPALSRKEFEKETVKKVLDSVIDFNNEGVVNYFMDKIAAQGIDNEKLKMLEALLQKAREGK